MYPRIDEQIMEKKQQHEQQLNQHKVCRMFHGRQNCDIKKVENFLKQTFEECKKNIYFTDEIKPFLLII